MPAQRISPSGARGNSSVSPLRGVLAPSAARTVPTVPNPSHLSVIDPVPSAVPAGAVVQRPRFNPAGRCNNCLAYGCTESRCIDAWDRITWRVCVTCQGSGFADFGELPNNDCYERCTCAEGLAGEFEFAGELVAV